MFIILGRQHETPIIVAPKYTRANHIHPLDRLSSPQTPQVPWNESQMDS